MQTADQELIRSKLVEYLGKSRLSMRQIADKMEVSNSMLSQVKNNRKKVGLDLAIKILKLTGSSEVEIDDWIGKYQGQQSSEYVAIQEKIRKNRQVEVIRKSTSEILEKDALLMELFLDVILAKDKGVSQSFLLSQYGHKGTDKLRMLLDLSLIRKENGKLFKNEENKDFVPSQTTLFSTISSISDKFKKMFLTDEFEGAVSCYYTDLNQEGYDKIKELHLKYAKEATEIFANHQSHKKDGGIRINFSLLLGQLQ
jgi:transcriptional regulator with XRE-family HTH domain